MILGKESNVTKAEFSKIVKLIAELFPQSNVQFTKPVVATWYEALSDLDYRRASEGVILYAQENNWMPTIADIRKYANKIPKYTKEEIHKFIVEAEKKEREKLDSVRF